MSSFPLRKLMYNMINRDTELIPICTLSFDLFVIRKMKIFSVSLKSLPSSKSVTVSFGVPQGSVPRSILFTLYSAPLEDIFNDHDLDFVLRR